MSDTKGVQVTLSKELAERLSLLRKFKHKLPSLNEDIALSVEGVVKQLEKTARIDADTWKSTKTCPACSTGVLVKRKSTKSGAGTLFYGCSRFPDCRHTESFSSKLKE